MPEIIELDMSFVKQDDTGVPYKAKQTGTQAVEIIEPASDNRNEGGDFSRAEPADTQSAKSLDRLKLRSLDFRLHYDGPGVVGWSPSTESAHWLLNTVYGRNLLKAKLAQVRPDLLVNEWRYQPELNKHLVEMVDALGLRGWAKPSTLSERVAYIHKVLKMTLAIERESNQKQAVADPC